MNEALRRNNFDTLRMVLSIFVVLAHFNTLTKLDSDFPLLHFSSFAVDAFFVVSGYLVCLSLIVDSNLVRYGVKRLFRIYPLYILIVIFQALILFFLDNSSLEQLCYYFFTNAFFLNFLAPTLGGALEGLNSHNAINGSLWTLKIEVGYYLILPLLLFLARKNRFVFVLSMYVFSAVFYLYALYCAPFLSEQLPAQLRFFVLGIVACFYGGDLLPAIKRVSLSIVLLVFGLSVVLMKMFGGVIYDAFIYPLFVFLFVFMFAFMGVRFRFPFELSFPIYILHFPVIQLGLYLGFLDFGYLLFFVYVAVTTLVLAYILNRHIELPSISMGRSLIRRWL